VGEVPVFAAPQYELTLTHPDPMWQGEQVTFDTLGAQRADLVEVFASRDGYGLGPCQSSDDCLDIASPVFLLAAGVADIDGRVTAVSAIPLLAEDQEVVFQAATTRGTVSILSHTTRADVRIPYDGCTDSFAANYDPLANRDDGSCVTDCAAVDELIDDLTDQAATCAVSADCDVVVDRQCDSIPVNSDTGSVDMLQQVHDWRNGQCGDYGCVGGMRMGATATCLAGRCEWTTRHHGSGMSGNAGPGI